MVEVFFEDQDLGKVTPLAIGKLLIEPEKGTEFYYNIPHLHYIICKAEKDTVYYGLLLELGIHFGHETFAPEKIVQNLVSITLNFLNTKIQSDEGFDDLISMVGAQDYNDFWGIYRQSEFSLAKEKRDLSSTFAEEIRKKAIEEFKDNILKAKSFEVKYEAVA